MALEELLPGQLDQAVGMNRIKIALQGVEGDFVGNALGLFDPLQTGDSSHLQVVDDLEPVEQIGAGTQTVLVTETGGVDVAVIFLADASPVVEVAGDTPGERRQKSQGRIPKIAVVILVGQFLNFVFRRVLYGIDHAVVDRPEGLSVERPDQAKHTQ